MPSRPVEKGLDSEMAGRAFAISFKWEGNLEDSLRALAGRAVESRELLEPLAKRVRYTMQLNIIQSRTPDGDPYRPLKLPIRKKVRTTELRPLLDSAKLINSFAYQFVSDQEVHIGDPTEYGIFQNFGTRHVPSREFIGIRLEETEAMNAVVSNWASWVFGVYDGDTSQLILDFNNA